MLFSININGHEKKQWLQMDNFMTGNHVKVKNTTTHVGTFIRHA